jgi:hypothetical protein
MLISLCGLTVFTLLYFAAFPYPVDRFAGVNPWRDDGATETAADLLIGRRTRRRAARRAAALAPHPSPLYQFCTLLT